jgi:hypothetical protein
MRCKHVMPTADSIHVNSPCRTTPVYCIVANRHSLSLPICSDYTGKQQCDASELVSFTAYSTNTCFGYGNFSSTLFTYNTTSSKFPR